jgi:hypothetical protein
MTKEVKLKEKDFYVYTHSLEGEPPFYVGKGLLKRVKLISRKNKYHTNIVNKYGKENIIVRSMLCRSEQHALDLEVKMIAALRNGGVKLTNMTDGGEGASGYITSEETRIKLSVANTGKIRSDETRAKISVAATGRVISEETREKLSTSHKGNAISDETKAKIKAAAIGRVKSEEHRAKLAAAQTGKVYSEESKAKMSASKKGRVIPDEHKAKLSAAAKSYWKKRKLDEMTIVTVE